MGNKSSANRKKTKRLTSASVASVQSHSGLHSRSRPSSASAESTGGGDIKYDLNALKENVENNGIAGELISVQIAEIVANFWRFNIDTMCKADQIEVACAIGFSVIAQNKEIKQIYFKVARNTKIQDLSWKLFDLLKWIILRMDKDTTDLYAVLCSYRDEGIGIHYKHCHAILDALNESFIYYFADKYTEKVKYGMNQTFMLFANIMTQTQTQNINEIKTDNMLLSLDLCLHSNEGQLFLYTYLNEIFCFELVEFLKLYHKFKEESTQQKRMNISALIISKCIYCGDASDDDILFAIEISDECKQDILDKTKTATLGIDTLYDDCYGEIYELLLKRHWNNFLYWK